MKRIEPFSFYVPTRIEYGVGKADHLVDEVKGFKAKRPFIVTDKGIVKAGILKKIEDQLKKSRIDFEVFSDVESNPRDTTVEKMANLAKETKVDIIIAVGGGSPMDAAKAAGMLVTNGGRIHDYFGFNKVKRQGLPLITMPTTAGTASEVTVFSVVTDTRKKPSIKDNVVSSLICPTVALADPLLTVAMPPQLTAFTGVDALSHAIEAYFSLQAEPITDALALHAIQLISHHLIPAVLNGENIEARDHMLLGSLIAGLAFLNADVGATHCIGEPMGGIYDVHHGMIMGILLPYVMEYNLGACPEKFVDIAIAMGEDIDGLSLMEAARKSVDAVVNLSRAIRFPTLKDTGIKEQGFREVCEFALKNVSAGSNPRKMTVESLEELLKDAYADKLKIATK